MTEPIYILILKYVAGGLYAAFGGMVHYLYQKAKANDQSFSWFFFFINIVVAFYIGQVAWDFLPPEANSKGGMMMLAGFFAYPALDFFEKNGLRWLIKKLFGLEDLKEDNK